MYIPTIVQPFSSNITDLVGGLKPVSCYRTFIRRIRTSGGYRISGGYRSSVGYSTSGGHMTYIKRIKGLRRIRT